MPDKINLSDGTGVPQRVVSELTALLRVRLLPGCRGRCRSLTVSFEERLGAAAGKMEPVAC